MKYSKDNVLGLRFTIGDSPTIYQVTFRQDFCVSWTDGDGHPQSVGYDAETIVTLFNDGTWTPVENQSQINETYDIWN